MIHSKKVPGLLAVFVAMVGLVGLVAVTWPETETQSSRRVTMDALEQSVVIYETIMADVLETYGQRGGGGISAIVQKSTTTFVVKISQEGRKDLITYEVEITAQGQVEIVNRTEETKSY